MHPYDPNKKLNIERICRVLQNSPTRNPEDMYNGALLLFHGTKRNRVHGILREGFKSSAGGRYGPGIYHSSLSVKCLTYAEPKPPDDSYFFFVNEIPIKYLVVGCGIHQIPERQRVKNEKFFEKRVTTGQCAPEHCTLDSSGSYINIGMYRGEELYEHVASDNIVVAKYLVHVKQQPAQVINNGTLNGTLQNLHNIHNQVNKIQQSLSAFFNSSPIVPGSFLPSNGSGVIMIQQGQSQPWVAPGPSNQPFPLGNQQLVTNQTQTMPSNQNHAYTPKPVPNRFPKLIIKDPKTKQNISASFKKMVSEAAAKSPKNEDVIVQDGS